MVGASDLYVLCEVESVELVVVVMVISVGLTMMVELENLFLGIVAKSGDIVDVAGPGICVLSELVTSVLSVSEEVAVGNPESVEIFSVLMLVFWKVTVSSVLLRERIDSASSLGEPVWGVGAEP